MAVDFFIPKLGDNVDKVTLVNWLVDDGAEVQEGDEIVEVETDKAVVPVPANGQGILHIGPYKAGDSVPVMTVIATIGGKDEGFAPGSGQTARAAAPATPSVSVEPIPEKAAPTNGAQRSEAPAEAMPKITPVAQKMAAEMGVDLRHISGSGDRERITKEDVVRAATPAQPTERPVESAPSPAPPPQPSPVPEPAARQPQPSSAPQPDADVLERIPLKGIRGIIFKRMAERGRWWARRVTSRRKGRARPRPISTRWAKCFTK